MKGQCPSATRGRSQSGQAVVEYVLVMISVIVVFFIAGGFLRQFNSSFSNFVKNYYGEYLSCLIETGELPTLGYEGGNGGCEDEFQPFTLAGGRAPYNPPRPYVPSGGYDGDGGGLENPPRKIDQTDTADGGAGGGARSASGSDGGSGAGLSQGPQLIGGDSGRSKRVPLAPSETGKKDSSGTYVQNSGAFGGVDGGSSGGRPKYVPIEGERDPSKSDSAGAGRGEDVQSGGLSPKRVPADVVTEKKKIQEEEGWTFPDFLRLLLIIGIILAMVVFFGGQALQMSNGGDN
jgi:hypothetical protein